MSPITDFTFTDFHEEPPNNNMSPKELSMDWQVECFSPCERGRRLFESGQWADCEFTVGEQRESVMAHKLILASSSPVFERMFFGVLAEKPGPIHIPDMDADAFKAMLQFVYSNKTVIQSSTLACSVYYGALKYMLPYLQKWCVAYLCAHLDPQGACGAYELGQMTENQTLLDESLKLMRHKTAEVIESSDFLEAQLDTVQVLFSLEPLSVTSELQLLEAAARYVHAKAEEDEDTTDSEDANSEPSSSNDHSTALAPYKRQSSEDTKAKTMDLLLRTLLQQIRFLTVDPEELTTHPTLSSLLTADEMESLTAHIKGSQTMLPMPEGFSICTDLRVERTYRVDVPLNQGFCVYYSPPVRLRNMTCKIIAQKNLYALSLCVFIEARWEYDPERFCLGIFSVTLVSHGAYSSITRGAYRPLKLTTCFNRGSYEFLPWHELVDPKSGFLKNNAFTLELTLVQ